MFSFVDITINFNQFYNNLFISCFLSEHLNGEVSSHVIVHFAWKFCRCPYFVVVLVKRNLEFLADVFGQEWSFKVR